MFRCLRRGIALPVRFTDPIEIPATELGRRSTRCAVALRRTFNFIILISRLLLFLNLMFCVGHNYGIFSFLLPLLLVLISLSFFS